MLLCQLCNLEENKQTKQGSPPLLPTDFLKSLCSSQALNSLRNNYSVLFQVSEQQCKTFKNKHTKFIYFHIHKCIFTVFQHVAYLGSEEKNAYKMYYCGKYVQFSTAPNSNQTISSSHEHWMFKVLIQFRLSCRKRNTI